MKKSEIINFLKENYNYDNNKNKMTIESVEKEEVRVHVRSISKSVGAPPETAADIPKDMGIEERFFFFCGDYSNTIIEDCIKKINGNDNDDYIFSLEFLQRYYSTIKPPTISSPNFEVLLERAKIDYNVGIYRYPVRKVGKNIKREAATPYNLVMIRVKENGKMVRKYMDAYLASSDTCTFNDVHYTVAQFQTPDSVDYEPKDSSDWPHNLLIFGAPGTGKSHSIEKKIEELGWQHHMKRVTFYEDYSYERFVGAYLPCTGKKESIIAGTTNGADENVKIKTTTQKSIEYRFVPGVFLQMIADAWFEDTFENKQNFVLVIEEINRANAASVFGDFFQLLDRNDEGLSDYSIALPKDMREWLSSYLLDKTNQIKYEDREQALDNFEKRMNAWLDDFKLPKNLYIWATMNSADQGVYPLDAAFKRRWSYLYKSTQETSGKRLTIRWTINNATNSYELEWDVLKTAINELMEESGNIEEDRFVGPWFFKDAEVSQIIAFTNADKIDRGQMSDPLTNKLFQYLRQDVFRNNPGQIFRDGYLTMSKIRTAMINGVGINDILRIDNNFEVNGVKIEDILKRGIKTDNDVPKNSEETTLDTEMQNEDV